jgi:peptidylprolyl isomerase
MSQMAEFLGSGGLKPNMRTECWTGGSPDTLPMRTNPEPKYAMKHSFLILLMAASTAAAIAQTQAKPPTTTAPKHAVVSGTAGGVKLPAGVPPARGVVKTAFSLRYQDIKVGTGPVAEPNKIYKVHYTGWVAADGRKFDSSYDHPRPPVLDKDGKPVMGEDGKPKQGDPQPLSFPQGYGRLIPGFDQGVDGMRIGGKRRIFIPWQLAYGEKGRPGPDAAHPGIPPKADLIFDVELVDVTDIVMPPNHPGMMPGGNMMRPGMTLPPGHGTVAPAQPSAPAQPVAPAQPASPAKPQSN